MSNKTDQQLPNKFKFNGGPRSARGERKKTVLWDLSSSTSTVPIVAQNFFVSLNLPISLSSLLWVFASQERREKSIKQPRKMTGGETSTTSIHPSTLRASDLGTTFASDYQASSSSSLPEQTQTHPAHSAYLRTALERDLNSIHQNVPRTTEAQNSKIYFDNVTREHSLAIQLQREKRRGDDLLEEVRNLKSKIRTTKEER